MILQQPDPQPSQPSLTTRPDVISDRGGLEPDRFFPRELLDPARVAGSAVQDPQTMFVARWWPAPRP
jgi:hypothetical protein